MDQIAVLIPCYNEEKTIGKVIDDLKAVLPNAVIYVYDNNSTDKTAAIAQEHGAVLRQEYQQGKGNVIRRMFREIDALAYLLVDGDDTYPAESAPEMARLVLEKNIDMVIGDRLSSTYYSENKRPFHNFGNSFVRRSINTLFHSDVKDIMTGYRAFSYLFVKSFPVLSKGFEIETEMTIHCLDKNMSMANVVIEYRDRPDGSVSKLNTVSDGLKVIRIILSLYKNYRPLAFFGFFAAVLALISVIGMIPILIEYLETGLVPRFPTLITCGFIMVAALLSFFGGLQLQTIRQQNKQDFEYRLLDIDARLRQSKAADHEKS